eukprot:Pgem_evm1s17381
MLPSLTRQKSKSKNQIEKHPLYQQKYLPANFFECVQCVTKQISFGGVDLLQNYSANQAME